MVVITTAAPVVAPVLPSAWVLRMAVASAFWVTCWSCALMLVTRSSPATGAVCLMVPVTSPAALTETSWLPALPRSSLVVLLLEPGLADQVDAGEAGHGQAALLHLAAR